MGPGFRGREIAETLVLSTQKFHGGDFAAGGRRQLISGVRDLFRSGRNRRYRDVRPHPGISAGLRTIHVSLPKKGIGCDGGWHKEGPLCEETVHRHSFGTWGKWLTKQRPENHWALATSAASAGSEITDFGQALSVRSASTDQAVLRGTDRRKFSHEVSKHCQTYEDGTCSSSTAAIGKLDRLRH